MSLLDDLFALFGYVPYTRYTTLERRLERAVDAHHHNLELYERAVLDLSEARSRIVDLEFELDDLRAELDEDPTADTADTAEEPPETPAPTPAATSPWRPPGWYRDTDGQVGRLFAVDLFRGTQTFRWGVGTAVLHAGPREERGLGPAELPRLEPVQPPVDEPAGGAR